jgi:ubiquinone/menaquinone biosynthesis C-methylase UbiE
MIISQIYLIYLDNEKLPFSDGEISYARTSHFLEHSNNIDHVINEVHRVLKGKGIFQIIVPYANSAEGMYPGHNIFFTEKWFKQNINFNNRFSIIKEIYYPSDYYLNLNCILRKLFPFKYARIFLFNCCWQMELICEKK